MITGGGTGLCRGIALAFAKHGCDVAITSRKLEHLSQPGMNCARSACGHCEKLPMSAMRPR